MGYIYCGIKAYSMVPFIKNDFHKFGAKDNSSSLTTPAVDVLINREGY
jgi:hypothetical protein